MKSIKRVLSTLNRKEKTTYFVLLALKCLTGVLDVVGLLLIAVIAAYASAAGTSGTSKPIISGYTLPTLSEVQLVFVTLLVLAVFLAKAVLALILSKRISSLIAQIEVRNSILIATNFISKDIGSQGQTSKGDFMWSIVGSSVAAYNGILNRFSIIVSESVLLLMIVGTFLFINPLATLSIAIYFTLLIGGIQLFWSKSLKIAGTEASAGTVQTTHLVDDVFSSAREINVYNARDYFVTRIKAARTRVARSGANVAYLVGMPRYIVETALIIGVVIFVIWQFSLGNLSEGIVTIGVFLTGGVRMMASLLPMQNSFALVSSESQQAQMILDAIESIENSTIKDVIIESPIESQNLSDIVEFKDVSFSYDSDAGYAVENINLAIKVGSRVAFIGPSGAGKSTLADLLLGLLVPTSGRVEISGLSARKYLKAFPGKIGYVPQKPGIISGTIAENVAFGVAGKLIDNERVLQCIKLAHLEDFVNGLNDGYQTILGSEGQGISGGQLQRLGLARALYHKPSLLILDEATSALDAKSENYISETIEELGNDVTVVMIAHRLATIQHCDRVFVVEEGHITNSGTFKELQEKVSLIKEFVELSVIE